MAGPGKGLPDASVLDGPALGSQAPPGHEALRSRLLRTTAEALQDSRWGCVARECARVHLEGG